MSDQSDIPPWRKSCSKPCTAARDVEVLKLRSRIEQLEDELYSWRHDLLTGMRMRRDFDDKFFEYFHFGVNFYLVLIDVDGLHDTNRDYGYRTGDALIKSVASATKDRINGVHYRIGGDEFAVLCLERPDLSGCQRATAVYEEKGKHTSINEMFDEADNKMKEKKRKRYAGGERRTGPSTCSVTPIKEKE